VPGPFNWFHPIELGDQSWTAKIGPTINHHSWITNGWKSKWIPGGQTLGTEAEVGRCLSSSRCRNCRQRWQRCFFWLTMAHYGTRRPEDGIFSWGKWCLTNGFRGSKYWPSGDCLSWKFLPLHVGFWSSHGPLSSPDFLHLICIPGISQLLLWKFPMFHDWRLDTNVWWLNSNRHT